MQYTIEQAKQILSGFHKFKALKAPKNLAEADLLQQEYLANILNNAYISNTGLSLLVMVASWHTLNNTLAQLKLREQHGIWPVRFCCLL